MISSPFPSICCVGPWVRIFLVNEMNVIAKPHDVVILMVVSAGQSFVLCTLLDL